MKKFYSMVLLAVALSTGVTAQTFSLVKDINPGGTTAFPFSMSSPSGELTNLNGLLLFGASDGVHGVELWKSDGTEAGTQMILEINPGAGSSSPQDFFAVGDIAYFRARNDVHGYELWKTDGTTTGTMMVKDINPGTAASGSRAFQVYHGFVFFNATDATYGTELWKTDGTEAGTVMVKDINTNTNPPAGDDPGPNSDPVVLTEMNDLLYFIAKDGPGGNSLWKTDGTPEGTELVKYARISSLRKINNNTLIFSVSTSLGTVPTQLWTSDGTTDGTIKILDLGGSDYLTSLSGGNGTGLFITLPNSGIINIWKTDGTTGGTVIIKTYTPALSSYSIGGFHHISGKSFFIAPDPTGSAGVELWVTDGTTAGTFIVKDIYPGATSSGAGFFSVVNNTLYFSASNGVNGQEMWRSNGTTAGTVMVQDMTIPGDASPEEITQAGSKIFALVTNSVNGKELWAANLNVALPLTLSDFKGNLSSNDGLLNWKTSIEQNTANFEIERSINRRNFTKAGAVTAAGNSSALKQYNYTDRNITSLGVAVVYYRLKTTDADGKFTYSKIIAINISSKEAVVMLYPNPVRESATLMIAAVKKENITYRIIDHGGRTVQQKNISVTEGSNMITLETTKLTAGVYTIILRGEYASNVLKLVKE